ncbi:MAG: hypothetical protein ABJ059_16545, partial [Hyphomicrobiales bacterium]
MTTELIPKTESGIKRLAKRLKSDGGMTHSEALDAAARQSGFSNFKNAQNTLSQSFFIDRKGKERHHQPFCHYHDTVVVPFQPLLNSIAEAYQKKAPALPLRVIQKAVNTAVGPYRVQRAPIGFEHDRAKHFACELFDEVIRTETGLEPTYWIQDILHDLKWRCTLGLGHAPVPMEVIRFSESKHAKAKAAILTIGVNAVLEAGLIRLDGSRMASGKQEATLRGEFEGIPFCAWVRHAGFYEFHFGCALWPAENAEEILPGGTTSSGFGDVPRGAAGEAAATTDIECLRGRYLQFFHYGGSGMGLFI